MNGTGRRAGWLKLSAKVVALASAMATVGCGGRDPNELPTVPAAGTVTYQGKPVAKGSIHFHPEKGRPASGIIDGGKFSLTTYDDGDGAIAGKHKVAVVATEDVPTKDGDTGSRFVVPEKFASPETSGVTIEVPPAGKKDLQVDIKK